MEGNETCWPHRKKGRKVVGALKKKRGENVGHFSGVY